METAHRTIEIDSATMQSQSNRPIDLVHLARMTMGDRSLEREVLQLFDRQAALLVARMRQVAPAGISAVAHTLKGSARGIGAWQVAHAAEAVEQAAGVPGEVQLKAAVDRLGTAADATRAVIAELLRAP